MVAKNATVKPDTKTYVLTMKDGEVKRVTVPAKWKVTFGALVPGSRDMNGSVTALRFYEGKDQQRAVFIGVVEFRDSSIDVLVKIENVQQERVQKETDQGIKHFTVEARETKWVNPDEDRQAPDEFKKLPAGVLDSLR